MWGCGYDQNRIADMQRRRHDPAKAADQLRRFIVDVNGMDSSSGHMQIDAERTIKITRASANEYYQNAFAKPRRSLRLDLCT